MDLSAVVDLQKVIEAEKKKTTLLMMRIANLCIVLGVLIFIALTVSASVSYFDRSSSTLVIGYGMVLFLIGCGVAILSVYKPDVNTCKSNNALSGINFGSGLVIGSPYLRQPNELSKTVQEFEGWFVFFGASILTASSFMIPAEIATMSLGFAQYIRTVRYSKGLTIGLSSLYVLSSVLCIAASKIRGRKMLLLALLFSILAFIGSVIHACVTGYDDGFWFIESDLKGTSTSGTPKAILSQTSDGRLYYPYWPLYPLQLAISTPIVVVISASFPLIFFWLHAMIGFKGDSDTISDIKESTKRETKKGTNIVILILL